MDLMQLRRRTLMAQPHLESASGSVANFMAGLSLPLNECRVSFSENRTGLSIWHTGKNLFDVNSNTYKNGYFLNDQGNEQSSSGNAGYTTSFTAVTPGTTYTFSGTISDSSAGWRIYYYNKNKGWIKRSAWIAPPSPAYSFTTPNDCYYIGFQYGYTVVDFDTFQLEIGEVTTPYEPYNGDVYTVTWLESVSGTFEAVTGILNVPGGDPIQLTPIPMTAKKGINNIWTDAETVAVRYYSI